jgi:PKD repeat protein
MPRMPLRTRRRPGPAVQLSVEPLEERALLSAWHLEFGTPTSPVAPGYTGVLVQPYDPTLGYGWQSVAGIAAVDRGTSSPLTRAFHQAHEATFEADVANGTYAVTLHLGDVLASRMSTDLSAEGGFLALAPPTAAGETITANLIVQVADGQLDLRLNATDAAGSQFALSALDIVPADPSAPPFDTHFNGTAPGGGWVTNSWDWAGGGALSATTSGGVLTLGGGQLRSAQPFSGAGVEGLVSFAAAPGQCFGMDTDAASAAGNYWALFGTGPSSNHLYARVNVAGDTQDVDLGPLPAGFHDYQINPAPTGFAFYVDGGLQTTLAKPIPGSVQLRLSASAFQGSPALQVGSVNVRPGTFRDDFNGPALDPGWLTSPWTSSGGGPLSYTLADGLLSLSGGELRSGQTFSNQTVQGRVAFANSPWQHFGMATDLSATAGNYWAVFSTSASSDHLYARVSANGALAEVGLGGLPRGFHDYRIDPTATGFDFYIDGSRVTTVNTPIPSSVPLHVTASVFLSSPAMQVDWVGLGVSASSLAADAGPGQAAPQGSAVHFPGAAGGGAGGGAGGYDYLWNFGDGSSAFGTAIPTHVYDDDGTYPVTLTVTDRLGNSASSTTAVTVTDVPPTATLSGGSAVNEGSPATISFSNQSDSSAADTRAGFLYSYDFTNRGVFDLVDVPNASVPHVFPDDGTYVVRARIKDEDGGYSDYTTTVQVLDVGPTAHPGGPYAGAPGQPINFSGSATDPGAADTAAGFRYFWSFGDGGTSTAQNPTYRYLSPGQYAVSLTVTDKDGASATATATVTVTVSAAPYVYTPYDRIPNFAANPTIVSVATGDWSNPNTWSQGRTPAAGDVVLIGAGTVVRYDAVSDAALSALVVGAGGKLTFRTDVSTRVTVSNFEVLYGGELQIGSVAGPVPAAVKAEVVFPDLPLNTAADPEQYGNGLVALGKVTLEGAVKTPFARLAAEPLAGQSALALAEPVSGWAPGDRLVLPDSRQLRGPERGPNYQPEWEQATVASVTPDGLTVVLAAPLQFSHPGARDALGQLAFLPQVADLSRNVVVRSQNPAGNRGQVMFADRADVDVRYAAFAGLGRTTINPLDNTTFDGQGNVAHVGGNEADRNPVQFRHLIGPVAPQADGYQYTFVGNAVFCPLNPMPYVWGINVNDSHYGLIEGNVLYNWAGAGLVTKTGSESYNLIEGNLVVRTGGTGARIDSTATSGSGFWLRGPNNYVLNNVATTINGGGWDVYSYGFNVFAVSLGAVKVPAYQGADPSISGQSVQVDMNATPLLQFAGNEAYGAMSSGMTVWWLGTSFETVKGVAGTVQGFRAWNFYGWGIFGYETNSLVIDGFVARGDPTALANAYENVTGIWFADYMTRNVDVRNADIQGMAVGIMTPTNVGRGPSGATTTIENSYLANVVNVVVTPPRSVNGSNDLSPKTTVIRNVRFAHPPAAAPGRWLDISLQDGALPDALGTPNFNLPDLVFVYAYNGVAGDNFQAFYADRAPDDAVVRALVGGKVRQLL